MAKKLEATGGNKETRFIQLVVKRKSKLLKTTNVKRQIMSN